MLADPADMIERAKAILSAIEFGRTTRYGKACPVCGGHEVENWGYMEKGPDRGHDHGCELRRWLDAVFMAEVDVTFHPVDPFAVDLVDQEDT